MVDTILLFRELLCMSGGEKSGTGGAVAGGGKWHADMVLRHVCGLLEVEPLHFSCHSTSDGTRMERMDTGMESVTLRNRNTIYSSNLNFEMVNDHAFFRIMMYNCCFTSDFVTK